MEKLYQKYKIDIKNDSVDKKNASLWAVFSTEDKDRDGDVIKQNWDLDKFKKNPVVVNSHQYRDATETIGKVENIRISGNNELEGKIKFAVDENPKAKVIFDLYAGGFLNAFSVGFIPKEMDGEGNIVESELLELSTVSVPSNAMALAKSQGVKVDKLMKAEEGGEEEKSPACRQEGETIEECVERKIPEIMEEEDVDKDQAVAMANSMCEEECSEKDTDKKEDDEVEEKKQEKKKEGDEVREEEEKTEELDEEEEEK